MPVVVCNFMTWHQGSSYNSQSIVWPLNIQAHTKCNTIIIWKELSTKLFSPAAVLTGTKIKTMSKGVVNASLAGICAAFAGIAAKFALAPENPPALVNFCDHYIPSEYVIFRISSIINNILSSFSYADTLDGQRALRDGHSNVQFSNVDDDSQSHATLSNYSGICCNKLCSKLPFQCIKHSWTLVLNWLTFVFFIRVYLAHYSWESMLASLV